LENIKPAGAKAVGNPVSMSGWSAEKNKTDQEYQRILAGLWHIIKVPVVEIPLRKANRRYRTFQLTYLLSIDVDFGFYLRA